jgi:molybdopterin-guanine dinucleotide biosynthesis protein A
MNEPFAAVLLAGGQSRRMGRDKAMLPLAGGRLLWQRQLDDVLRPLGPAELLVSGPSREGFPADVRCIADAEPGLGPLSGIAAALEAATAPWLAVLAVDLPGMTAGYLKTLLNERTAGAGMVPVHPEGWLEPLAAIYPRACLPLARARLSGPDRSMHGFVREALSQGHLQTRPIRHSETILFANWNAPPE